VANEVVDSRKKKSEPGILCKLDLEKAYNHGNRTFLDSMMLMMGQVEEMDQVLRARFCIGEWESL